MRVVLDTSALWHPEVVREHAKGKRPVVLPAVALAERARQVRREGGDPGRLLATLAKAGVRLEAFEPKHALGLPSRVHDEDTWRKHARDALIAAHVGADDLLVTADAEDFLALGVPKPSILEVPEKPRLGRRRRD